MYMYVYGVAYEVCHCSSSTEVQKNTFGCLIQKYCKYLRTSTPLGVIRTAHYSSIFGKTKILRLYVQILSSKGQYAEMQKIQYSKYYYQYENVYPNKS